MFLFAFQSWVLVSRTLGEGWGGFCSVAWGQQAGFSPPEPRLVPEPTGEPLLTCTSWVISQVIVSLRFKSNFSGSAGQNGAVKCRPSLVFTSFHSADTDSCVHEKCIFLSVFRQQKVRQC